MALKRLALKDVGFGDLSLPHWHYQHDTDDQCHYMTHGARCVLEDSDVNCVTIVVVFVADDGSSEAVDKGLGERLQKLLTYLW